MAEWFEYESPSNIFTFLGIALYASEGIGLILPIRSTVGNAKLFRKLFKGTFIFVIWCYASVGIFSYLRFGNDTKEVIFFNFKADKTFFFLLSTIYMTSIFISNPIGMFPVFLSIYKSRYIKKLQEKHSDYKLYITKYVIWVLLITFNFTVCLFAPNFIKYIEFIGAFLMPIIGIYVPVGLNYSYFK